jgi:hypothetical protein
MTLSGDNLVVWGHPPCFSTGEQDGNAESRIADIATIKK